MRAFSGCAHSANSCISATESPPPETAIARSLRAGEKPSSRQRVAEPAPADRAHLHLLSGPARFSRAPDAWRSIGIFRGERGKSGTTFLHLAHFEQCQSELQHAFGRALRFGYFFISSAKSRAARRIVLLRGIGDVAGPIQRVRRTVFVGMRIGEIAKRLARLIIVGAGQQIHRRVELAFRIGVGRRQRRICRNFARAPAGGVRQAASATGGFARQ